MPLWHSDLKKRKITGGKRKPNRTKKAFEAGSFSPETRLGEDHRRRKKTRSGVTKVMLLRGKYANIVNPLTGKTERVEVEDVLKNPAGMYFDRRKIITKGTVIKTQLGEAVVTSRPGQDGVINAVLM